LHGLAPFPPHARAAGTWKNAKGYSGRSPEGNTKISYGFSEDFLRIFCKLLYQGHAEPWHKGEEPLNLIASLPIRRDKGTKNGGEVYE
jgi:hypothetical protein